MCGIVGITNSEKASLEVLKGLLVLQHRGQDSAGILSYDSSSNRIHLKKDIGLVSQVFNDENIINLKGNFAIGHTRYSTIGLIDAEDIQPLVENYPYGTGAVHNGNIENYTSLKAEIESTERYLTTNNDLEIMMHYISIGLLKYKSDNFFSTIKNSVKDIFEKFNGGYSYLSIIAGRGMIAFRDQFGIRPLVLGILNDSYIFASETNVLTFLGYKYIRDVKPGEVIYIDEDGKLQSFVFEKSSSNPCMFEWVYFSSAESTWHSRNMYNVRLNLGKCLGEKIAKLNLDIDLVSPVPDTSRSAAISLAETLKKPYREVLIKNRYIQRSFILNTQVKRKEAVDLKFSIVSELVENKNILLVDDSIVRGTTSKKIIELLRKYGANKIYLASTCPPIIHPCFYGIAFPSRDELVMNEMNEETFAKYLGCDQVIFTDINDLKLSLNLENFCQGCLNGIYPKQ